MTATGRVLLAAILTLAAACTGSGSGSGAPPPSSNPGPPPTTAAASQAAVPLLPDDAIRAAITAKQEILVVRVTAIEPKAAGSRSETTTYSLEIVRAAVGASTGTLRLSHYGPPNMAVGHLYVISTRDGNPMWGTKGVRDSVAIAAGQEEAAANAHAAKAKQLGGP